MDGTDCLSYETLTDDQASSSSCMHRSSCVEVQDTLPI